MKTNNVKIQESTKTKSVKMGDNPLFRNRPFPIRFAERVVTSPLLSTKMTTVEHTTGEGADWSGNDDD